METYQTMLEDETQLLQALDSSPEWVGAHWIESYYELLSEMCELEEDDYGDTDLDWFCSETNFGKNVDYRKMYDMNTGRTWDIKSPEVLYDFIMRED